MSYYLIQTSPSVEIEEDGGGVRGLSSLIILQEIIDRAVAVVPRREIHPYEYFDIISGTGTGG